MLSTPNLNAFADALQSDPDQMKKSEYFALFRATDGLAEKMLFADDANILRRVYAGKSSFSAEEIDSNVRRFSEGRTLTCALNWYRTNKFDITLANITVPTLYIWGDQDMALGEMAAVATAQFVTGPYCFERLAGKSHWLMEDSPDQVISLLQTHLSANVGTRA